MWKDITRQMLPFVILLAVLWISAEILQRSFSDRPNIIAPPVQQAPPRPTPLPRATPVPTPTPETPSGAVLPEDFVPENGQ